MGISKQAIRLALVLLAVLALAGCGAAEESTPAATEAPVVTAAPTATPEPAAPLEESRHKQALAALDKGDVAAACELFGSSENPAEAAGYLAVLEPLLRKDWTAAAEAALAHPGLYVWQPLFSAEMAAPETLEEILRQNRALSLLTQRSETWVPLNEAAIESIDREETHALSDPGVGPIVPGDRREALLLLDEGAPELEVCGQGGGKALIVRRQPDYWRGAVYAAVDKRLGLIPPGLEPLSLDEVDYILYLDYDYRSCGTAAGLDVLQIGCVLRLVDERSGAELYCSETLWGDTDGSDPFRLEHLSGDGWVPCGNPPIGQALAEAIAALPEA